MRLLLDTHVYLWVLAHSPRLSAKARALIETAEEVYVSAASIWEACIKIELGRLAVDPEGLVRGIAESGFVELPVLARHTTEVARLPSIHRDPFDRLLVAQALADSLRLLTADLQLAAYSDQVTVVDRGTDG
jgi:PIN domain nuclease of toxin-antitoxin system